MGAQIHYFGDVEKVSFMQCMSVFVPISAVAMINKNFNSKRMPRLATPFRAFVVLPRCLYIGKAWLKLFSLLIFFGTFFYQLSFFCVPCGTQNDLLRCMLFSLAFLRPFLQIPSNLIKNYK